MSKDCQHSYHLDGTDPAVFLIIFFHIQRPWFQRISITLLHRYYMASS